MLPPCLLTYKVSWNGVLKAGQADVLFQPDQPHQVLKVSATARSTGPARLLWSYDAVQTSWIDQTRLLPTKIVQIEEDRRETNSYKTEFVGDFAFNKWVTTPKVEGVDLEDRDQRIFEQPAMHDLVSAALYLRSQPLDEIGQQFNLVTFPFRDPYLVMLTLEGREPRKFDGEKVDAIKFDLKLSKVTKDGTLRSQEEKLQSATIWLTDDERRLPLELRSEIFVGSVRAALVGFHKMEAGEETAATPPVSDSPASERLGNQIQGTARNLIDRFRPEKKE